jgi:hypothetical protein
MPPDGHRSEGTLSLSEVPYAGAKPFGLPFRRLEKVTRCKSETASGSTRSNGYSPNPPKKPDQKIATFGSSYTGIYGLSQKPRQPPKKESAPMTERNCDCPNCKCTIKEGDHAYAVHGKHYCCEACAHHHKGGEECSSKGCHCAHPK